MPILPKGNPNRLLGQDCGKDPSSDSSAWELTVDYMCGKSFSAGAVILQNLDKPIVVFSWDVEGIDPSSHRDSLALNR